MDERIVCCCGSKCWVRFIGWLGVVFLGLVLATYALSLTTKPRSEDEEQIIQFKNMTALDEKLPHFSRLVRILEYLNPAIMVVLFIMSVVLLKGSYNKNPKLVCTWVVFSSALTVASVFMAIVWCLALDSFVLTVLVVVSVIVFVPVNIFFTWIVNMHKREMIKSRMVQISA